MKLLLLALAVSGASAETPDVTQIMARVAENQARSQELRTSYVYGQKQLLRLIRGNGKLAREERREYVITPAERGTTKELAKFDGKYEAHGKYVPYGKPDYRYKGMDIDGELINEISESMTNDKQSRDGIARDMFPLTAAEQAKENFKLAGTETFRGRQVYRIDFEPKPHVEDAIWKGEALIDCEEYEPVMVHTTMALKIPAAVKILLGTNLRGVGFSVSYEKVGDGAWFPVSYGGEFELRAVFFYKRTISVAMVNSDFRRTDVKSNLTYVIEQ